MNCSIIMVTPRETSMIRLYSEHRVSEEIPSHTLKQPQAFIIWQTRLKVLYSMGEKGWDRRARGATRLRGLGR